MAYTCTDSDTYNTHTIHTRAAQIEPLPHSPDLSFAAFGGKQLGKAEPSSLDFLPSHAKHSVLVIANPTASTLELWVVDHSEGVCVYVSCVLCVCVCVCVYVSCVVCVCVRVCVRVGGGGRVCRCGCRCGCGCTCAHVLMCALNKGSNSWFIHFYFKS